MRIVLSLLAALCSTHAIAQATEQDLYDILSTVKTLEATFFQQVLDDQGDILQESSGTIALQKPGKFRWHYAAPYSQDIVADGKNLWMFDIELAQASVQPLQHALGSAPIILLTDLRPLAEDFEIRPMDDGIGLQWLALVPKVLDTEFYRIELGMDKKVIREMRLFDHFDQQTIIRFSQVELNKTFEDNHFKFYIPEGVDVIGDPL